MGARYRKNFFFITKAINIQSSTSRKNYIIFFTTQMPSGPGLCQSHFFHAPPFFFADLRYSVCEPFSVLNCEHAIRRI